MDNKVIQDIMKVVGEDKEKLKEFIANPKELLEKHNIDFDSEKIHEVVDGLKSKIDLGDIAEKGEDIIDGIKDFFKK